MEKYDPQKIEKKWQEQWEREKPYGASDTEKNKYYALIEFPYPSGDGLHVGHVRSYTAMDIVARKRRMEGYNVLYPIGWDAFGLPTENYAVKTGIHPKDVTKQNTDTFRRQLKSMGFSFDWGREVNTTDPDYYKWTQWMFIQFFKHGLAYKNNVPINWCLSCKIGLANEEVVNGKCERCGGDVEKRNKDQWMIRITKYADKLLEGLKDVNYIPQARIQQENWIGRSEGAEIEFPLVDVPNQPDKKHTLTVFTTRPDTLFGSTFMVVSPELAKNWIDVGWKTTDEVKEYIENALKNRVVTETEEKEKTGVPSGVSAINPATNEKIPVWISDYVLSGYGTGAIMAVPAHDDRDLQFALKFDLEIRPVIAQVDSVDELIPGLTEAKITSMKKSGIAHVGDGLMFNSGEFNGMDSEEARHAITKKFGTPKVQYKLRDWVFSRQRYWGEPIPLVFCEACHKKLAGISNDQFPISKQELKSLSQGEIDNPGWFAIDEKDLPVELPQVEKFQPTDTGESPLATITDWVNTTCPKCKGPAKRETDVMPNWAGSSWYFLRYTDPHNDKEFASKKHLKHWMPV